MAFSGHRSGLQAIGADNGSRGCFLHEQMVAALVEAVGVQLGLPAFLQPLVHLDVEYLKTQVLGGADVRFARSQSRAIGGCWLGFWRFNGHSVNRANVIWSAEVCEGKIW